MFDKEAIQELSKAQAIAAASAAVAGASSDIVALPNDFAVNDLEKYMMCRRRMRGSMKTSVVADFAAYVAVNAEDGAAVFVDPDAMSATAVLNLGGPDLPGHADNTAVLALRKTAAFAALSFVASGAAQTQVQVAEFLEDWAPVIECRHGDTGIGTKPAIAAVRSITIEGLKRVQNVEQQLSANKSAFESVEAKADELLPTFIDFTAEPYLGLSMRTFTMRLAIRTGDKPAIVLRIVKAEQHAEEMAAELAARVREAIDGGQPVLLGAYRAT